MKETGKGRKERMTTAACICEGRGQRRIGPSGVSDGAMEEGATQSSPASNPPWPHHTVHMWWYEQSVFTPPGAGTGPHLPEAPFVRHCPGDTSLIADISHRQKLGP